MRLRNPGTGLVVSCEGDLAARYQSLGWVSADAEARPARKAAAEKPEAKSEDTTDDKPVKRSQARRRQ
ncbi:hypothetical protein GGQ69_000828 [Micrococcus sp. TA1]|nr:hypothetical protein [Micrococcus sp. TA1]